MSKKCEKIAKADIIIAEYMGMEVAGEKHGLCSGGFIVEKDDPTGRFEGIIYSESMDSLTPVLEKIFIENDDAFLFNEGLISRYVNGEWDCEFLMYYSKFKTMSGAVALLASYAIEELKND